MKITNGIVIILISMFFLSCGASKVMEVNKDSNAMKNKTKFSYIIGPQDVLQVYVWKQPDLSMSVPVRIDGKISLPLVNDIQASGLTPIQLKEIISKKMAKFIESPTVSVIITAINSKKIIITGNVKAPGVYKIGSRINILEAISMVGGLSEFADQKNIKLVRKENNKDKTYIINYKKIIDGSDFGQNIDVFPGDTIIVP